ncbi:MAG: hypothetical protein JSV63_00605, partial [Candidatus Aenigmatarchaeota archaeon]
SYVCDNCGVEFVKMGNELVAVNYKKFETTEEAKAYEASLTSKEEHDEWLKKKLKKDAEKHKEEDEKFDVKRRETGFAGIGKKLGRTGTKSTFSLILLVIGLVIGAILGWPFTVAFAAWGARNILPTPEYRGGHLWNRKGNRYDTGIAVTKSLLKLVILFFLGWGFFATDLPFRGILLLAFFFMAYFSLPGEYSPSSPYEFMEGIWRPVVAVVLAFYVFGGIFQSPELMWLCLAFFGTFPIARERGGNLAEAIGQAASGAAANYETVDKIIFVILMLLGGAAVMGWIGAGTMDIDWGTTFGNIFLPFWIIAFIGGLTSPANVRPYTGVIILLMVFIFFTAGTGEQIVGQAFFGAWWPTVHNGLMSFVEPISEGFGALGNTFGQTFLLLTNPVGYAQQIVEGTYEQSPTGPTGAFGVEIKDVNIPAIHPGTMSLATLNIENVGPRVAKDVIVRMTLEDMPFLELIPEVYYGRPLIQGLTELGYIKDFESMQPGFKVPLIFEIDAADCEQINQQEGISRLSKRNEYIRATIELEYTYEVDSWMPLEIISENEWRERVARGTFVEKTVISHISTSPAKLSIGSFDQPIIAGNRPFYIGLNLTSAEGRNSEIIWDEPGTTKKETIVTLQLPIDLASQLRECNPRWDDKVEGNEVWEYKWNGDTLGGKAVYCTAYSIQLPEGVPSTTYYIRANSTFRFRKTETKDTLFAFTEVCIPDCETLTTDEECDAREDCLWTSPPDATEAMCLQR